MDKDLLITKLAAWLIDFDEGDDVDSPWAVNYIKNNRDNEHGGDCPIAEHKAPITCDRCVCDDYLKKAEKLLTFINNSIKDSGSKIAPIKPTKKMIDAVTAEVSHCEGDWGTYNMYYTEYQAENVWELMLGSIKDE